MGIKVAIIESVGPEELYEDIREGDGLMQVLKLMNIGTKYYQCHGTEQLVKAIKDISENYNNLLTSTLVCMVQIAACT
jgi:hypothetical protein